MNSKKEKILQTVAERIRRQAPGLDVEELVRIGTEALQKAPRRPRRVPQSVYLCHVIRGALLSHLLERSTFAGDLLRLQQALRSSVRPLRDRAGRMVAMPAPARRPA